MILTLFAAALATSHEGSVRLVTDEAESVLRILALEGKGEAVNVSVWSSLYATDGYRRLKQRELGMKRKFEDDDFRKFVESSDLISRRAILQKTLDEWIRADVRECRRRALAYLPKGADIEAKVYLLIKPLHNSFVWEVATDPAIMLYLDPEESKDGFVGTVAHEMHHIGYGRSCPSPEFAKWLDDKPQTVKAAYEWLGAFGEGYAVLAAAGGIGKDPQAWPREDVKAAWANGMARQPDQFKQVEAFFMQVLKGELNGDKIQDKAMEFYGIVGPWYTVGYTVATTIERVDGRSRLIECYRDPRLLLPTYNEAARKLGTGLPVWTDEFVAAMK